VVVLLPHAEEAAIPTRGNSYDFIDYPEEADTVNITAQEWKICYQIEVSLKTMGFWQFLEGEKYVTGSMSN